MPETVFPQTQTPPSSPATGVSPPTFPSPPLTVTAKKRFRLLPLLVILGLVFVGLVVFFLIRRSGSRPGESGEITWWGLWEDEAVVNPLLDEYQQTHPKVKMTYVKQSPQDYRERLTNALAKGEGPDIFLFHNSWTPLFKDELDPLPANVMNSSDFVQTFYPVAAADLSSDAGIVGLPLEYDGLTLFINDTIFQNAQKSPPATWDDLRALAMELTQKDEQGNILQAGVALGRTENVDHWPEILALMMLQNGVDLTKPTSKAAADALRFFTLFSSTDGVWDQTLPASTAAFAGGKLAMYFAPSWRVFEIVERNPSLKFRAVPLPQLPQSASGQKGLAYATYWAVGVGKNSQSKTTAWDFLKFLTSQDSLAKLFSNASQGRAFGEPYPRLDMANLLKDHPVLGALISDAPNAESWFLQSRTFDGPTGINTQINKYFEDAVNAITSGKTTAEKALGTAAQGVNQVLRQYRLVK